MMNELEYKLLKYHNYLNNEKQTYLRVSQYNRNNSIHYCIGIQGFHVNVSNFDAFCISNERKSKFSKI